MYDRSNFDLCSLSSPDHGPRLALSVCDFRAREVAPNLPELEICGPHWKSDPSPHISRGSQSNIYLVQNWAAPLKGASCRTVVVAASMTRDSVVCWT